MSFLGRLQGYQYNNVERACNDAIREAVSYGLSATELKQMMAHCWEEHFREQAKLGAETFLA